MYKYGINFIYMNIQEGYRFYHNTLAKEFVLKSKYIKDGKYYFVVTKNDCSETKLVLDMLYENCLIEYDNNLFKEEMVMSDRDYIDIEYLSNSSSTTDINKCSCKEIFRKMDEACKKVAVESYPYSEYLWHITDVKNLESIIKTGKLLARAELKNVPVDMMRINETSSNVMNSDTSSKLLRKYVRLYFNPCHEVLFSFKKTDGINGIVLLKINREIIEKSPNPTLMTNGNAHYAKPCDFNWKNRALNKKQVEMPSVNFEEVYSPFTKDNHNDSNRAEVLVYKEIDIKWIDAVCFETEELYNKYRHILKDSNIAYEISKNPFWKNIRRSEGNINDLF